MTENELLQLIERAAKEDLQELTLWSNRLSSLPPEIGKLTNLQELVLSNNRLSSLPPEIGTLTSLQWLDLSNNQLSNLPPEIDKLTSLQWLDLSNNQISLPLEIDKLGERELREPVGQDDSHHRNENDRVTFSVFGPQVITPGQNFLLDLWAHLPTQAEMVVSLAAKIGRGEMRGVKTGVAVASGAILSVLIEIPSLRRSFKPSKGSNPPAGQCRARRLTG
jgi:Leucine rich repeat